MLGSFFERVLGEYMGVWCYCLHKNIEEINVKRSRRQARINWKAVSGYGWIASMDVK